MKLGCWGGGPSLTNCVIDPTMRASRLTGVLGPAHLLQHLKPNVEPRELLTACLVPFLVLVIPLVALLVCRPLGVDPVLPVDTDPGPDPGTEAAGGTKASTGAAGRDLDFRTLLQAAVRVVNHRVVPHAFQGYY